MDNITHSLCAVMLSRAGLNRISPHATLLLVVGSNVPDLDVLSLLRGPSAYLQYHRGASHSLIAAPALALAATVLVWLFRRKSFGWWKAYLVALAGVASNSVADLANAYGVQLFWPFSDAWFHADFLTVFDVWILMLLAFGLAAPWFSRLVNREIGARAGSGRGVAIAVLCLAAVYAGGKYLLHERAIAVLDSRLYQGEVPLRLAALPSPINPFLWTGLVEGRGFIERHTGLNFLREFDPSSGTLYYKPAESPAIAAARRDEKFRALLAFAQWPLWTVSPAADPEGATKVELFDLRFNHPEGTAFAISGIFDAEGRAVAPVHK
jgi:inner membrane protein